MSNSIIATTYDLLTFHKSGNDNLFDNCFEKAFRHLDVSIDEQKRKKYRNIAFHYLRTTGYIDVVRSESRWAVSPTVLVQCNESTFALVGGSTERQLLHSIVSRDQIHQVCARERNYDFAVGVTLFPDVVQLKTNASEAKRIAGKIGVNYSPDYQDLLFRRLPSLQSVLDTNLAAVDNDHPIFEPNSTSYLSLKDRTWVPYAEMQPYFSGLYRSDLKYAAPRYHLAIENADRGFNVFHVEDKEWALICLYAKLSVKLPLRYEVREEKLSVPRGQIEDLRMPTLLEKCFRSGTFDNPIVDSRWFVFSNIKHGNLWQFIAKFPVFSLEVL